MKTEIKNAIAHSASHDEIVTVRAHNKEAARDALAIAKQIAVESGLHYDSTDSNEGSECWACKGDSERMEWRLDIRFTEESMMRW